VGIETGGERDAAALRLRAHRSERKSLAHGLAAPVVHGAGGSSHLCVGKARQLLLAEVDQAPLSLQERQQVERRTGGLRTRRCGQRRAGSTKSGDLRCEPGVEDDAEPGDDGEPQARKERGLIGHGRGTYDVNRARQHVHARRGAFEHGSPFC